MGYEVGCPVDLQLSFKIQIKVVSQCNGRQQKVMLVSKKKNTIAKLLLH